MRWMFDLDDTLYDLQDPFNKCLDKFYPEFVGDRNQMYKDFRAIGDDVFEIQEAGIISMDASLIYRIWMFCKKYQLNIDIEKAKRFKEAYRNYQYNISMTPLMIEFLKEKGHEIAVLSNGQDAHQRRKFEVLELEKYIDKDHLFTSGQLGIAKPNKEAFLKVIEQVGGQPDEWCYVGDSYHNDMVGAHSAGMHTLHFNRHHNIEGPCSQHIVYSEEECLAFIRNKE